MNTHWELQYIGALPFIHHTSSFTKLVYASEPKTYLLLKHLKTVCHLHVFTNTSKYLERITDKLRDRSSMLLTSWIQDNPMITALSTRHKPPEEAMSGQRPSEAQFKSLWMASCHTWQKHCYMIETAVQRSSKSLINSHSYSIHHLEIKQTGVAGPWSLWQRCKNPI